MHTYDVLIVGSGLYGSTLARLLTDAGKRCLVIDKKTHIAGHCYTETIEGISVHRYGPHIFHTHSEEVWEFVTRYAHFIPFLNRPKVRYKERIFSFPINLMTLHQLWGVCTPEEARCRLKKERVPIENPANMEEFLLSEVGSEIYEIFFKGYTKKQWGKDPKDLPAAIAKRLPYRLSFEDAYYSHRYQGIPAGGYTPFVATLLEGIPLELNSDYFSNQAYFDSLAKIQVFTGAIDAYFNFCHGRLEYRSMNFEFKILEGDYQGNAVINYTEESVPYVRTVEHKHFENLEVAHTVVSWETPCTYEGHNEPYYPMSDVKNRTVFAKYEAQASVLFPRVVFGGRLGEYRYYDMDEVIASALKMGRRLLNL